jgi:hypothetical protein
MGKLQRLELWWQLYVTWVPKRDVRNIRPLDFCWTECTKQQRNAARWLKLGLLLMDTCQSTRLNLVIHAPCPNWLKWGWKARIGNWRKCEPNRTACISIVRLASPQSQQNQGSTGRTVFQHTCTLQCTPVRFNIGHSTPTYNKTTESVDTVLCTKKHSDGKTSMCRCPNTNRGKTDTSRCSWS